uniref:Uncharacterized protein n=1 Tax=Panagrolaimus sp. ES5 TaxID=591445 RepID=A0AC34GJ69_9BILA
PRCGSLSPSHDDEKNQAVLKMLDLNIGKPEMAEKYAKGTLLEGETELDVITNVFGLKHAKPLNVNAIHLVLAKITIRGNYPFKTYKRRLPDYTAVMRRRFYQQVMPLFYQKYSTLFGDNEYDHLVDYANTMFSFANLSLDDENVKEKLLELSVEEAASVTKNASVSLSLKRGQLEFMGDNFSGVCRDLDSYDAS